MGRLRIRQANNNDWMDICQSEWYVRNNANDGWIRITPAQGIKARHGSNNYWVNITCLSDEECGDDLYGGTEDGKGENNSGSAQPLPGDQGYPGETDGSQSGGGAVDPWDPNTYLPSDPDVIINPDNAGNNSEGNPDYNNPNANESEEGEGDSTCPSGTYSNGSYPPGYDLPDICGPNGGATTDENGDPAIYRPGTDTIETVDEENGQGTSDGDGSQNNAYVCPASVSTTGDGTVKVTEFYVDLGTAPGTVTIEYANHVGINGVVAYLAGKKVATTDGGTTGVGKLTFEYDPTTTGGDTQLFMRVRRVGGDVGKWTVTVSCPGIEQDIGSITEPAPCMGTFEPNGGGGRFTEVVHQMGPNAGNVRIEYQMWNIRDKLSVFQGNTMIASTDGFVSGEGHIDFAYTPQGTNTLVIVRIESESDSTAWKYLVNCPGATGGADNPSPCDNNNAVQSGGAGRTDLFFDLGPDAGVARVRYQAWQVADTFSVYQQGNLLATTGPVTGEGYLPFQYVPANGDVQVTVQGTGDTTWAFIMECPTLPAVTLNCGEQFTQGANVASTIVNVPGASNTSFVLCNYATVDVGANMGSGVGNTIEIDYNATVVENTGSVRRYLDKGYGALVIPMTAGVNSMAIDSVELANWWEHTTWCPAEYVPVIGMTQFMRGVPHVYESSNYTPNVGEAVRSIASTSDLESKARGCQVLMSMIRASGSTTFRGYADDHCMIYLQAAGSSSLIEVGPFTMSVEEITVDLPADTYFVHAFLEEVNFHQTPCLMGLEVTANGTGRKTLISSKDWYGCYFEPGLSFGANSPIFPAATARIYDTNAEAQSYMNVTGAPSPLTIFNTWGRYDGGNYYNNRSDAEANAPGSAAAQWQYNTSTSSFEQLLNTDRPNGIVSQTQYNNYTFECTIASTSTDDDTNGIILAYKGSYDGTNTFHNYSLVLARSSTGQQPAVGYGLLYVVDGVVTTVMPLTPPGTASGGWGGKSVRLRATRNGDSYTFSTSAWDSTEAGYSTTVNISDFPAAASTLSGPGSIGFYTHSQASSRFYDVVAPGLSAEPVFAYETGTIWEYGAGAWNLLGNNLAFSTKLGAFKHVTSSGNGAQYAIFKRYQRKL